MERRVLYNPKIKDKVTILKSPEETNNEYALLEIELDVHGGNGLHYHKTFTEEFIPVEGELGVRVGNKKMILGKGQSAVVGLHENHHFYNPGDKPIRFQVKLVPGHHGFLKGLAIAYGLAADDLTNKNGVPKKLSHLAVVMDLTETFPSGILQLLTPLLRMKAKAAKKNGIYRKLIDKYC